MTDPLIQLEAKLALNQQAREREKKARLRAEELLELKSRELFLAKIEVEKQFNILEQQKLELELLSSVTLLARDHANLKEVFKAFIDAVCKMCHWPIAHVFVPSKSETQDIRSLRVWHLEEGEKFIRFKEISETTPFKSGIGLPGRVFESGQSLWIEDVLKDPNFPRAEVARDLDVRAGFGIPIKKFNKIIAVCEFFAPQSFEKDEHLLSVVESAANQLSLALERHQSEHDLIDKYNQLQETLEKLQATQTQLIQAEKLSSVGQLAAGIAHEINTPTQYIGDNTRFLQDSFKEVLELTQKIKTLLNEADQTQEVSTRNELFEKMKQEYMRTDLEYLSQEIPSAISQSLEGISRVSEIVGAMKEFSHPGEQEKTPTDINHALQTTLTVARNEWKYAAEIESKFSAQIPQVPCLPGELNQVFLNLIVNAAHAIEERFKGKEMGRIIIETLVQENFAEIRIGDNGNGIPEEVRNKVFDPFFTTKGVGKGSGQGLAIAYSVIVNKHHGKIHFESKTGFGTTFIIRLPLQTNYCLI